MVFRPASDVAGASARAAAASSGDRGPREPPRTSEAAVRRNSRLGNGACGPDPSLWSLDLVKRRPVRSCNLVSTSDQGASRVSRRRTDVAFVSQHRRPRTGKPGDGRLLVHGARSASGLHRQRAWGRAPPCWEPSRSIAEATTSIIKVVCGTSSDWARRRKPLVVLGYDLSACIRPFFAVAETVSAVLVARVADRLGKGMRDAPRDALVADLTHRRSAVPATVFGTRSTRWEPTPAR
jgi:hypothetical protein